MSEAAAINTASGTAPSVAGAVDPPYAPSWLHRLVTWVEGLPWPFWVRGFASAMLLPVTLLLVQQAVSRLF